MFVRAMLEALTAEGLAATAAVAAQVLRTGPEPIGRTGVDPAELSDRGGTGA